MKWLCCSLLTVSVFFPLALQAHDTTIVMTNLGYEPNELTIAPGKTITFINNSQDAFWPASDDHPTHTHFDGTSLKEHCTDGTNNSFDACRAIAPGDRWSFTFTKPGEFPFHDHLWPHLTGSITVSNGSPEEHPKSLIERFVTVSKTLVALVLGTFHPTPPEPPPKRLIDDPFVRLTTESDPHWAIEALRNAAASSTELSARCHEVLHDIGKEAFYQYGSFEAASVFQSDYCNSGYLHGVFEAYFSTESDPQTLQIDCAKLGTRPFDQWQCQHGVGHGYMYFTGGDLDASLELCDQHFSDSKAVRACYNGVYMELFNEETLAREGKFINSKEPLETCLKRSVGVSDCYLYVPTYLSQQVGMSYQDIFAACAGAPPSRVDSCKVGTGSEMMKRNMSDPKHVFDLCGEMRVLRDQLLCVAGAVGMYINQTASPQEAYALCTEAPAIYAEACLQTVDNRTKDFAIDSQNVVSIEHQKSRATNVARTRSWHSPAVDTLDPRLSQ